MEELSIFMIILIILALLLPVFAIIHLMGKQWPTAKKLLWVAIILFIPYLGSIVYLVWGRNQ
jgi:hypothetical protein